MWARDYQRVGAEPQPWPALSVLLREAPLAAVRDDLSQQLTALIQQELSRDPEVEDVLGESRIFDLIERQLSEALPWYGGVLSVTNTALTGFSPERFLVDGEGEERIHRSVTAILSALDALPAHLSVFQGHFTEIRAARMEGAVSIGGMESVLDAVIEATGCRPGWPATLIAAFQWMHEACRVPLPEQRRAAMSDWLEQTCFAGEAPEAMIRAEILTAMARSMSRTVR
ncbi:MAG: hypothetical protein ACI8RZ_002063 [Myxococcota bacterium]|jgi:hypothetical protein